MEYCTYFFSLILQKINIIKKENVPNLPLAIQISVTLTKLKNKLLSSKLKIKMHFKNYVHTTVSIDHIKSFEKKTLINMALLNSLHIKYDSHFLFKLNQ